MISLYVHALETVPFIISLLNPFQKHVLHSLVTKNFGYLSQNCGKNVDCDFAVITQKFQRKYSDYNKTSEHLHIIFLT